jgi:hypothetical protein
MPGTTSPEISSFKTLLQNCAERQSSSASPVSVQF